MATTSSETSRADTAVRDKAVRLFTYLKELTELRGEVKRSCDDYDQVIWWTEIPKEKECYCAAWDLGREAAYDDWIRAERPRRKRPPSPPASLAPWLNEREVADSSLDAPPLKDTVVEEVRGNGSNGKNSKETIVRKLEDWPAISRQWDLFVQNHWLPWALEDRRLQNVQSIYNELFTAFQKQERLGEAFEVVVGVGLLTWHPPHGPQIRRHVVSAQATIEFDSTTGVITVGPASDGARLSLDQDMLEPQDRPLPEMQNQIQLQLAGVGDDLWTGPSLTTLLNAYFQQISSENALETVLEPQDGAGEQKDPRMTLAPALIVRQRTDRNLVRIFSDIAEQLGAGGPIPIGVEKLVQIRDDKSYGEDGDSNGATSVDDELYFPLPANEAQRQIAQRLASRQGVLVQGPPGTGKSHTIANLICHLLASGKRLLVTSHTARALRVLKKYFPPEISPLCVSLLGDDSGALRELEESVQGILNELNLWDIAKSQARVHQLVSDLDRARRELAEAHSTLKTVRCGEAERIDLGFAGYQGTPQSLARRMVAEADSYRWLSLDIGYHDEPPLTNEEAVELLNLIRELGDQPQHPTETFLPDLSTLLEPGSFDQLVLRERELTARHLSVSAESRPVIEVLSRVAQPVRASLETALRGYLNSFDALALETEPWVKGALQDVAAGRYHSWANLATATEARADAAASKVSRAAEARVSGLEGRDRTQVRADAECLHAHLASGNGIGIGVRYNPFISKHLKASLYVADTLRINGHACDQQEFLEQLISYLDVIDALEYIDQQWSPYVQPQTLPILLAFGDHTRRAQLLRRVLGLRTAVDATTLLAKSIPDLPPIAFHERQSVATLISLLSAAVVEEELRGIQREVARFHNDLGVLRREPQAHGLISALAEAVEARDLDRYSRTHGQFVAAWALRARLQRRRALEHQLCRPDLVARIISGRHDVCWDDRLSKFELAWHWSRANKWLREHADPHREASILLKIDLSQERIREDLRSLAVSKAWQYVLARLQPEQREHLMAWKLAVKKIGKGTGKYAIQYRREARYHLDHCRSAIPAWVMPIFRVAETTKPAPDQFDVAIIDEASQSGPEALFLQYIARKIVVVGDDQQISPESVGLDRGAVESLRERYIKDLPHWDALGVDNSFFDQAQIRFAGRVRLREHFRCMPEIIQFSNNLCYQAEPLVPLRQYGTERVVPVVTRHVADGYAKGTGDRVVNRPEAEAIVEQIVRCLTDPAYEGKSFGVICLQGNAQSNLIRDLLIERIGAQRIQKRGIVCGNAYAFQGDERDVIFLSMVAAVNDGRHIGVLSKESDKRRFNVAASRARDQMWLFHSVNVDDLSSLCLRRQLLEYCLNPRVRADTIEGIDISILQRQAIEASRGDSRPPSPFDSWFEVDVFLQAANRGFRVIPQYELAGKRIDLLVEGIRGRLAVECDGDEWHGLEEWDRDVERQRMLERCGLQFWRVRGSAYYRDPEAALQPLWQILKDRGIYPTAATAPTNSKTPPTEPTPSVSAPVVDVEEEQEEFEDGTPTGLLESADGGDGEETDYATDEQAPLVRSLADAFGPTLPKYVWWMPRPLPDPHSASLKELMEGLIEIVSVEGPVVCRRAYALYNRAAGNSRLGKQIVHVMNRAIYRAVKLGRLEQNDEQRRGGQINQIVRVAGGAAVNVRERGPRTLEEVPPLEIASVRELIAKSEPVLDEDQLVRLLAGVYGVGRVTTQIRKLLLA